ncbi:unnamed protein product [Boreogadus saida]
MTRGRPRHVSVFVHFVRLFFLFLLIQQSLSDETGDLRPCNETECDSTGSRWRVAVPRSPGACSNLPPPLGGRTAADLRPRRRRLRSTLGPRAEPAPGAPSPLTAHRAPGGAGWTPSRSAGG